MSKADGGLRGELRAHLGHLGQWSSIETGGTEQGVPDTHLQLRPVVPSAHDGFSVWIECKRTTAWKVKFKPAQVGWLFTCWRYGGCAWIFTWRQHRSGHSLYVTSAGHVRELSIRGLQGVPHVLHFEGGPDTWSWNKIEALLRRGRG